MRKMQMRKAGMMIALCVVCLTTPVKGMAATVLNENKVEITEYKEGKVISSVNVREGAGVHNPKVTVNKKNVVLTKGMLVTILEETKVSGKVWYHVKLTFDGQEVTGYSSGAYIKLTGNIITPEPTETPVPTATVTVTPKVTVTLTPTVAPIEPEKETAPESVKEEGSNKKGLYVFALILAGLLAFAGVIYYIIRLMGRSKEKSAHAIQDKVENLKNINLAVNPKTPEVTTSEGPKIGKRSDMFDSKFASEASEVYLTNKDLELPKEETFDTGLLSRRDYAQTLQMIESLKEHDIIYHKFLGRGEVFDNSDVKLIEIRFKSGDSRFFNKKDLASKNLIRKVEKKAV